MKFFLVYRHCQFPARKNQKAKWNKWTRYSCDFDTWGEAEKHYQACLPKMKDSEEIRISYREERLDEANWEEIK